MTSARREAIKKWYAALKAVEPEAYKLAIRYSEGFAITYDWPLTMAADVEAGFVMLACELLDVKP